MSWYPMFYTTASVVMPKFTSLSMLQNARKREVDLEYVGLTLKDVFNGIGNGFNDRCTIMA